MTDELKPCPNPWCAPENRRIVRWELYSRQVFCTCGVKGPLGKDDAEATTAWNTRTAPAGVKVKELRWEDCGEEDGWCADTVIGRYWVRPANGMYEVAFFGIENEEMVETILDNSLSEPSLGFPVAQADYEQRILSAIDLSGLPAPDDGDEAYKVGLEDGYTKAVQDIDLATGGDGEFKGSTFPGETVDVPVMKARIVERLALPTALVEAARGARDYLTLLYNRGDIDGQVGGEVLASITEALASLPGETPEKPAPVGPVNCTHVLRRQGKAYPRTCQRCGLGPCPFYNQDGSEKP